MVKSVIELLKEIPLGKTLLSLPDRVKALEDRVESLEKQLATPLGDRCEYCGEPAVFLEKEERGINGLPNLFKVKTYKCRARGKSITKHSS